jgi:putative endonuclease
VLIEHHLDWRDRIMVDSKTYYIYIMNSPSGTLYTGITNDLRRRIYQHKHKLVKGFIQQYNIVRLAYFEETTDINAAIAREKEIKGWRRSKKIELIKSMNPQWKDLAEDWYEETDLDQMSRSANQEE